MKRSVFEELESLGAIGNPPPAPTPVVVVPAPDPVVEVDESEYERQLQMLNLCDRAVAALEGISEQISDLRDIFSGIRDAWIPEFADEPEPEPEAVFGEDFTEDIYSPLGSAPEEDFPVEAFVEEPPDSERNFEVGSLSTSERKPEPEAEESSTFNLIDDALALLRAETQTIPNSPESEESDVDPDQVHEESRAL